MGTVVYAGSDFKITDGEVNVADLVVAKGSAIEADDNVFIYTDNTRGILGVQPGESIEADYFVGEDENSDKSIGELRIYGGGTVKVGTYDDFNIIEDYGILTTGNTDKDNYAVIDANESAEDIDIHGGVDVEYLEIKNIKSGGYIDLENCRGRFNYPKFSGKSGASYYIKGVPETGFMARGCDLGTVYAGLYTDSSYDDVNLTDNSAVVELSGDRQAMSLTKMVPGRIRGRNINRENYCGQYNVKLLHSSAQNQTILQTLQTIHSNRQSFLFVARATGTDQDYPVDILVRARLEDPTTQYNEGIQFREQVIRIVEDA